jgi:hypothetical protein
MRAVLLTLVLGAAVFAGASGVLAGNDPSILSQEAPAITTQEFLQCDGRTQMADYKGEVVFLEIFATW